MNDLKNKDIAVTMLVWNCHMIDVEMEDYLDDIRLSVSDLLADIPHKWMGFIFPGEIGQTQAVKMAHKKVFDLNKSAHCMVTSVAHLNK